MLEASVTRLRAIMMTSIATVLGAVPLMLSGRRGRGIASGHRHRHRGGVSLSTFFTLFIVPSLYLLIGSYTKPRNFIAEQLEREEREFEEAHGGRAPGKVHAAE